jgi:ribosomal protein L32
LRFSRLGRRLARAERARRSCCNPEKFHGRSQKESLAHEERRRPHHIDLKSGKYRGKQILPPKADI